jgi:hypothetical protein
MTYLLSDCLTVTGGYTHTHEREEFIKHSVERDSVVMIYIPSFVYGGYTNSTAIE